MLIRNATLFRLSDAWRTGAAELAEQLAASRFAPTSGLQAESWGWVEPTPDTDLVYDSDGQYLITMRSESRVMPAGAVELAITERAADLEGVQGFKPGRKQLREIKEAVIDDMLPRAFRQQRDTRVWINTRQRLIAIDSATPSVCDHVTHLLSLLEPPPAEPLHVKTNLTAAMTRWVADDMAPDAFTLDTTVELRAAGNTGASVRFQGMALDPREVIRHIHEGRQATLLALTWMDRVSFVLTETMALRQIRALDVLQMQTRRKVKNPEEFANDFALTTGELSQLFGDIIHALGGIQLDLVQTSQTAPGQQDETASANAGQRSARPSSSNDHLQEARRVVVESGRASISFLQRRLGIGYNRAAELLEALEASGVVAPEDSNGTRAVLMSLQAREY